MPTSFIRSTIDFLQSSFSGFFAAKSSKIAVTSTACGGAAGGEEGVAGAAGVVGLVGVAVARVGVGEATAEEVGVALLDGAAVACPNIFDMRFVNIPITVKHTPRGNRKPAPVIRWATSCCWEIVRRAVRRVSPGRFLISEVVEFQPWAEHGTSVVTSSPWTLRNIANRCRAVTATALAHPLTERNGWRRKILTKLWLKALPGC